MWCWFFGHNWVRAWSETHRPDWSYTVAYVCPRCPATLATRGGLISDPETQQLNGGPF